MIVDFPDTMTVAKRQRRLRNAVEKIAIDIEAGEAPLSRVELEQVARLCEDYFLLLEAARVMRWMAP